MNENQVTRAQGIDFGEFADALEAVDYPVTSADLVAAHGDLELGHANGHVRVADVLGPVEDTFAGPAEVRRAVIGLMGMDAVGRKRYTDRGGTTPGEERGAPTDSL